MELLLYVHQHTVWQVKTTSANYCCCALLYPSFCSLNIVLGPRTASEETHSVNSKRVDPSVFSVAIIYTVYCHQLSSTKLSLVVLTSAQTVAGIINSK